MLSSERTVAYFGSGLTVRIFWVRGDMLGVVFHICTDSFSEKNILQICKNTFQTVILSLLPDAEEAAIELITMHQILK